MSETKTFEFLFTREEISFLTRLIHDRIDSLDDLTDPRISDRNIAQIILNKLKDQLSSNGWRSHNRVISPPADKESYHRPSTKDTADYIKYLKSLERIPNSEVESIMKKYPKLWTRLQRGKKSQ